MEIGMTPQAIPHLSNAIGRLRRLLHESNTELNREIMALAAGEYPPTQEKAKSQNEFRDLIRTSEQTLATLLTVRALAYQQLGSNDLCDQDRAEVRSMSLDADKIAASLPEDTECIATIQISSAFLDTRGFIIGLGPPGNDKGTIELSDSTISVSNNLEDALRDLNQSVFAFEVFEKSLESDIHNHAEGSVPDPVSVKKTIGKQKAVLLYHRLVVREKAGDGQGAKRDAEEINALDCQPGPHLF
jgi:tetratricopeptide (TPR) repeat protein